MYPLTKPTGGLYVGKRLLARPKVTRMDVGAPVRIAFVSDVHLRKSGASMTETVAQMLEELRPHLVLFGGDYAESREGAFDFFARMGRVLPGVPKYGVMGNNDNDFFENDREPLFTAMRENGVIPLINECARLTIDGKPLEIVGVDDAYLFKPCARGLFSEETGVYRILLSHAPHTFLMEEASPDLMLSGHTHGGQVNALGLTCYTLLKYENWFRFTHLAGVKR